jgi:SAM-dependent methyltransferase
VLAPGDRLLDLGAGRGWPGSRIAALSGCDLVTVDLPLTALREAREHMRRRAPGRAGAEVCGDGARLPFRDACFQAVTHADVLCWLTRKLSVLRECRRVLERGGRVAAVVVEVAPGLGDAERRRALELGPGRVDASGPLEELMAGAGLAPLESHDWTGELRDTLRSILAALARHELQLRAGEGDEVYDHELAKKARLLEGVEAGLLRRTLVVAERRTQAK